MSFPLSRVLVPELIERESSPSTNSELVHLAADPALADFTTLVTFTQTAGRGRLERAWVAPPGASLAVSVLLRSASGPALPSDRLGWLPIAAGVAMSDAVSEAIGRPAGFKWPNDVLVRGRKVSGILAELLPPAGAAPFGVVLGAGVNIDMTEAQLPVPTATSLRVEGAADDESLADRVLARYLGRLRELVDALRAAAGDADAAKLREAARERCVTLGKTVNVELPHGSRLVGVAEDLDADGRLVVRSEGRVHAVSAGDVTHVR